MNDYPQTITDGAGLEITFLRTVPTPEGKRLEITGKVAPGAGPRWHVHHLQQEGFTIRSGRIAYEMEDGNTLYAHAGESIVLPAGQPHRFWNDGDEVAEVDSFIVPAYNARYFLTALYDSAHRNGGRPHLLDMAFLLLKYRTEFGVPGLPAFAMKVVLPFLYFIGKLSGRYRKYRGAPDPIHPGDIQPQRNIPVNP